MISEIQNSKSKIAIVGAGPAGASLAIRLAQKGFRAILIERERFPRHKLCGEFISPECLAHFAELDVLDSMLEGGGDRIAETIFYAPGGKNVSISSKWFGSALGALSLSRAEMDQRLMKKAREIGVEVLEETQVTGVLFDQKKVCGVKAKNKHGETIEIAAGLFVDATGRANVLGRFAEKIKIQNSESVIRNPKSKIQKRFVGFKTHLENASIEKSRCEIYFFPGGYGGLSRIENDLANHCFLIDAETVKRFSGSANEIVENVIFKNKRAAVTLKNAAPVYEWLAVSIEKFGARTLNPAKNLFSIGDSAAFIDPFTGSGMLMALESAKILAECITENCSAPEQITEKYKASYRKNFHRRLQLCAVIRRAAFMPNLSGFLIAALAASERARRFLARSTRRSL